MRPGAQIAADQILTEPQIAGGTMNKKAEKKTTGAYVYVKDRDGVEYICRMDDLKKVDTLSEEDKAKCMAPQGDA
jgi:hypothetical protein